jgi:hypothetical protein
MYNIMLYLHVGVMTSEYSLAGNALGFTTKCERELEA